MNLITILFVLQGQTKQERELFYAGAVDPIIAEHIEACFDERNRLYDVAGDEARYEIIEEKKQ